MAATGEQDRMISEFSDVTGADAERARFFLESSGWQLHVSYVLSSNNSYFILNL